jgi:hypothetical protein
VRTSVHLFWLFFVLRASRWNTAYLRAYYF